ncbi:lipoprotein [Salipiger mucosus]|uniref:Lipoprotein, putative n=1 Tax=Salipiger mucosus DSM 16094 TaxID=1123237 RepID=S9Q472_9RHOB|nr:lipoprotein [Salipiger mucosus]EPX76101.1 lipoprotein, putative [Salipiger mucosus DSM 16094]
MSRSLSVLLVAALVLGGCATVRESRVNPFNWFGRGEPVANTSTEAGTANPLIPKRRSVSFFQSRDEASAGRPVGQIAELLIERRPGGAVIRASGVADRLGPFDVRLVKDEAQSTPDTLVYDMRALQQPGPRNTNEWSRTVTAAVWLTDQELFGVQTIRVTGQRNALASRR